MMTSAYIGKHKINMTNTSYNYSKQHKNGLVFNSKICHIRKLQITFYGTIFTVNGMKPDPIKVQALQDLSTP